MATKAMTQTQLIRHLAESCPPVYGDPCGDRAERDQEEWPLRPSRHRAAGQVETQGSHGKEPSTGAAIKIAAKTVVKFRVAKAAKDSIAPSKAKKK